MAGHLQLSMAIFSHPSRAGMLKELIEKLKVPPHVQLKIITDEKMNLWEAAKEAWNSYSFGATHHLVIQDDIEPCEDFIESVITCCRTRPNSIISYFNMSSAIKEAKDAGKSWVVQNYLVLGQAISMPTHMIPRFMEWEKIFFKKELRHDDERIGMFCVWNEIPVYYTVPCLVEHKGFDKSINKIGGTIGGHKIVAGLFEGTSGVKIDWSLGLIDPYHGPNRSKSSYIKEMNDDMDAVRYEILKHEWTPTSYIQAHEYIFRAHPTRLYYQILKAMELHGYEKDFKNKTYKYVDIDGYKYWFMDYTINRERLKG